MALSPFRGIIQAVGLIPFKHLYIHRVRGVYRTAIKKYTPCRMNYVPYPKSDNHEGNSDGHNANASESQNFRTSELQNIRTSELQNLRASELQNFRTSEPQNIRTSEQKKRADLLKRYHPF
jgi:hypothetical protein